MKKSILLSLTILSILVVSFPANAQDIFSNFGGIKTNYEIFIEDSLTTVYNQGLVKRAEFLIESDSEAGLGLGYSSVHFECTLDRGVPMRKVNGKRRKVYVFEFMDSSGGHLGTYEVLQHRVEKTRNNDFSRVIYSIDFIDVPLVVLENTARINFAYHFYRSSH